MRVLKFVTATGFALALLGFAPAITPTAHGQITLTIGGEPNCPYGYFDYAPYNCAPDGYYGPEWFNGGRFIGAGKWHHGGNDFHGHVNNSFDPHHGYKGPMPKRGEAPSHHGPANNFHGNEVRDGHGHSMGNDSHGNDNHGGGDHHPN
jgi:hypothetical protein